MPSLSKHNESTESSHWAERLIGGILFSGLWVLIQRCGTTRLQWNPSRINNHSVSPKGTAQFLPTVRVPMA